MKKILCISLALLLIFNSTVVYADVDIHGGSSGSFDSMAAFKAKYPDLVDDNGHLKASLGQTLFEHMILLDKDGAAAAPILSAISEFLNGYDNSDDSISLSQDGSTIHFHERFTNELNSKIQDSIHAFDGYYLIEPSNIWSLSYIAESLKESYPSYDFTSALNLFSQLTANSPLYWKNGPYAYNFLYLDENQYLYFEKPVSGNSNQILVYDVDDSSIKRWHMAYFEKGTLYYNQEECPYFASNLSHEKYLDYMLGCLQEYSFGAPSYNVKP